MESLTINVGPDIGTVSALLDRPDDARALLALAHGAGAGMHHRFMAAVAERLAGRGLAVLRYQFPFTEAGKRRPDRAPVCEATVRAAVTRAGELAGGLPLFAGGKSMGGRMTSRALAEQPMDPVRGIVFLGFPLHPPGKPSRTRADHLRDITAPMLFVQGTRDKLAPLDSMREVVEGLNADRPGRAQVHVVDTADHGFAVLKRSGRTDDEALDEIADAVTGFCAW